MWLPVTLQAEHSFSVAPLACASARAASMSLHGKTDVVQPLVAALRDPGGKAAIRVHRLGDLELYPTEIEDRRAVAALAELFDLHLGGHAQQTLVGRKRSIDIAHRKGHMFNLGYFHAGPPWISIKFSNVRA